IQFLKHLERCRLLLHVVDVLPADGSDPAENALTIVNELAKYSKKLAGKPRWLVFNKLDLVLEDELEDTIAKVTEALDWDGPVFSIAAASRNNTERLAADILNYIELLPVEQVTEQIADPVNFKWDDSPNDVQPVIDEDDDDDDFDDDDYDVEVIYQR
ncbi:MAG: GTPase ObgE, partial [Gammaproteobacteria bacterium]|nr:GTPase ObgE [Gammaproteobacteria bacterium]MBU1557233.1 GTPase ObgE [Gammaproteobacteria bacterium]